MGLAINTFWRVESFFRPLSQNVLYAQHSGALHMALGCWGLLTFGPQVCRVYGSFTFFLIYILGGISGNLTSFLHTPEPTVGGTVRALKLLFLSLSNSIMLYVYSFMVDCMKHHSYHRSYINKISTWYDRQFRDIN